MIKIISWLVLVSCPLIAFSKFIHSPIYKIEIDSQDEEALIKFDSGEVAFVNTSNKQMIDELRIAKEKNRNLLVEIDDRRTIQSFKKSKRIMDRPMEKIQYPSTEFTPSVMSTMNEVRDIFKVMRRDWQYYSQCYNRAHIWAYEAYEDFKLNSMKLFMFFTSSYIREYRYEWWFHVSPMTFLQDGSKKVPFILDRRFSKKPLGRKSWSDLFIYSKRECPVINSYSYYENNQQSEHCYHIPVSMYFWQPRDIERYEQNGVENKAFLKPELRWAYREAF